VANGTSFAAPFVTACAALMLGRALRKSTALDGECVRRLLVSSARPFARNVDAYGCGAGMLDVPAALQAVDAEVARNRADYDLLYPEPAGGPQSYQTVTPN
jgi:hypothetical protein